MTSSAKKVESKFDGIKKTVMPSLEYPYQKSPVSNCNQEEQIALKNEFIADANEIGKEYLKNFKK